MKDTFLNNSYKIKYKGKDYSLGSCPCGKSSDAFAVYANGSTHCFSCNSSYFKKSQMIEENTKTIKGETIEEPTQSVPTTPLNLKQVNVSYRSHSAQLLHKYNVRTFKKDDTTDLFCVDYAWPNGVIQRRAFPKRIFYVGDVKPTADLFLSDVFGPGSAKTCTITEGCEDALSVIEMFGDKYPAYSVRSASTAVADCKAKYDLLMSFDKIVLCFDDDEPGRTAADRVAQIFPFGKVAIVNKKKHKDANAYHMAGDVDEYRRIWWNAKPYVPENIVSTFFQFEEILREPTPPALFAYPWPDMQKMTRGIRTKELTLIKGLEGIGKTEVIGRLEIEALRTTDYNIGVIHLEEPIKRTLQRIATYQLLTPVHLSDEFTPDAVVSAVKELAQKDNRIYFYKTFGANSIDGVLNQIRWLVAACNCRAIFLDHITRIVTGMQGNDDTKDLDYVSTKLAQIADELDCAIIAISHVNDDGKTRGSRNITKESATVIHIERDLLSADPVARNTTCFILEKNRWASATGPAGSVFFDDLTFTLVNEPPEIHAPPEP